MMKNITFHFWHCSLSPMAILTVGLAIGAISSYLCSVPALAIAPAFATTSFPDTQNYWGQPFIQALAARAIVTGYLDNTYRPEQPVKRDEFAAILRNAFSQPLERRIESGSIYKDIPEGYWAASAIHDAYEMGFMTGYPGGEFRPNQSVTKVEVLTSLAQNLKLPPATAVTNQTTGGASTNTPQLPIAAGSTSTPQQSANRRRRAKRPLMFPVGMTALMQPLVKPRVVTPAAPTPPVPNSTSPLIRESSSQTNGSSSQPPVSVVVRNYYQDAAQIPQYAVNAVAQTTAAGIVVNYPDRQVLNPTQPVNRGEIAALIHQALVYQGKINPLPDDSTATNYIVAR